MKTSRIILILLLVIYGLGTLYGAIFSLFFPGQMAGAQHLGELSPGIHKSLLLSGAMLAGQFWIYFSAIALLIRKMKEGYMYAITLGFIELIQAIIIIISFGMNNFGSPTDYFAILKGGLLLTFALFAFKKQQTKIG